MSFITSLASNVHAVSLNNYRDIEGTQVPMEYTDPITLQLMVNPVIVQPSGFTYDQTTIDELKNNQICFKDPMTRTYISSVMPNRALKDAIQRFCEQYPVLKKLIESIPETQEAQRQPHQDPQADCQSYTVNEFAGLFSDKNKLTFSENREIRIYNHSPKLVNHSFTKLSTTVRLDDALLDDALIGVGKKIKYIDFQKNATTSIKLYEGNTAADSYLSIKSSAAFSIEVQRGCLFTKIDDLINRMIRGGIEIINIDPFQVLVLRLSARDKN
jgi:hypothetical protein